MHNSVRLSDRAVVDLSGADVQHFLDRLLTCRVPEPGSGGAVFGALLTPQGKIQFDFFLIADGARYLFDIPAGLAADFVKRMTFYRLRAAVDIVDRSDTLCVAAAWGGAAIDGAVVTYADPRAPDMGTRAILDIATDLPDDGEAYETHRIACAVPKGGVDFQYSDAFPHDAGFDQIAGVDFKKGCFVGQEVVSRMQHRGTARRRPVAVIADVPLTVGAEITAGGPPVGTVTSADGARGLAIVRLDRAASGVEAGEALVAGDVPVRLARPDWAGYDWPEALGGASDRKAS